MGECVCSVVKLGCLHGALRMASGGVGRLTHVDWFTGPIGGGLRGRGLSYHPALSATITFSITLKPLPGVVTLHFFALLPS